MLFAAGNDERDVNPADGTLDQGTVGEESLAKNVICVGASENLANEGRTDSWNNSGLSGVVLPASGRFGLVPGATATDGFPRSDNADHIAMFSDRGRVFVPPVGAAPAVATGRVKPDLVAPGTNILSTGPIIPAPNNLLPFPEGNSRRPSADLADSYYIISGTSMATPHVAGAALLVRQYYRQVYGQLRRPVLLEQIPNAVDRPAIATHPAGCMMAWVRRDAGANQNHIVAARFDRTLARQGNIVQLTSNVGDQPAPMLAQRDETLYLLHRGSDNKLRLSCFNATFQPVAGFGSNGVVTIPTVARAKPSAAPPLSSTGTRSRSSGIRMAPTIWSSSALPPTRALRSTRTR